MSDVMRRALKLTSLSLVWAMRCKKTNDNEFQGSIKFLCSESLPESNLGSSWRDLCLLERTIESQVREFLPYNRLLFLLLDLHHQSEHFPPRPSFRCHCCQIQAEQGSEKVSLVQFLTVFDLKSTKQSKKLFSKKRLYISN